MLGSVGACLGPALPSLKADVGTAPHLIPVVVVYATDSRPGFVLRRAGKRWECEIQGDWVRAALQVDRGGRNRRVRLVDRTEQFEDLLGTGGKLRLTHGQEYGRSLKGCNTQGRRVAEHLPAG